MWAGTPEPEPAGARKPHEGAGSVLIQAGEEVSPACSCLGLGASRASLLELGVQGSREVGTPLCPGEARQNAGGDTDVWEKGGLRVALTWSPGPWPLQLEGLARPD